MSRCRFTSVAESRFRLPLAGMLALGRFGRVPRQDIGHWRASKEARSGRDARGLPHPGHHPPMLSLQGDPSWGFLQRQFSLRAGTLGELRQPLGRSPVACGSSTQVRRLHPRALTVTGTQHIPATLRRCFRRCKSTPVMRNVLVRSAKPHSPLPRPRSRIDWLWRRVEADGPSLPATMASIPNKLHRRMVRY